MASWNQGTTGSGAKLILRQGVLYRVRKGPNTQEEIDQLVLPIKKREEALALAYVLSWTYEGSDHHSQAVSQSIMARDIQRH